MLISLVVCTGGLIAIGFSATAPVGAISDGYDSGLDGLDNVGTFFTGVGNTLEGVKSSFADLGTSVSDLGDALRNTGDPEGIALADQMRDNVSPAVDAAATAMDGVEEVFDDVALAIHEAVSNMRQPAIVDRYASQVPYTAAVVFASCSLLLLLTLVPIWLCRCAHYPSSCLVIIFGALIWLVAASVLAAGLALSDICIDPPASLRDIAREADTSGAVVDTIDFFTSCTAGSTPPGALGIVTGSLTNVTAISNQFDPLASQILSRYSGDSNIVTRTQAVSTSINASVSAVGAVADSFSCRSVKSLYVGIVDPFCNRLIGDGILPYMALQLAVGVVLLFSLFFNLAACYRHPSAPADGADGRDADGNEVTNPLPSNVGSRDGLVFGEPLVKDAPPRSA